MDIIAFEFCFCVMLLCTGFFAVCGGVYFLQLRKNSKMLASVHCYERLKEVMNEPPDYCD